MVGVIISAVCTVIEYNRLMRLHRENKRLAASYWSKLAFLVVEVSVAIAFGVCLEQNVSNAGGILEWGMFSFFSFILPMSATVEISAVESSDQQNANIYKISRRICLYWVPTHLPIRSLSSNQDRKR